MTFDMKKFEIMTHLEEAVVSVHAHKEYKEETVAADVAAVEVATEKKEEAQAE